MHYTIKGTVQERTEGEDEGEGETLSLDHVDTLSGRTRLQEGLGNWGLCFWDFQFSVSTCQTMAVLTCEIDSLVAWLANSTRFHRNAHTASRRALKPSPSGRDLSESVVVVVCRSTPARPTGPPPSLLP